MNWEAIGAVGEILGALGVIVTLAYLASQIKQNTRATKAQALQSLAEAGAAMNAMVTENADVAHIFRTGLSPNYSEMDRIEKTRFTMLIAQWVLAYESVFLQHELGTIDESLFTSRMENLRLWLNTPGGKRSWEVSKAGFSTRYVEYVEKNIISSQ